MILAMFFQLGSGRLARVGETASRRAILEELVVVAIFDLAATRLLLTALPLGFCLGHLLAQLPDEDSTARIMVINMLRSYRRRLTRTHWPGRMKPECLGFFIRILAT